MIGILLKRQLAEVWRGYFFDSKTGNARPKVSIALRFAGFVLLMVGFLGFTFTMLALSLCELLASADVGWLYFTVMGATAVLLGTFGAVFNSFSSLFLAKDNDLLLAMPIPISAILASRMLNVYLLGLMYTAIVLLPTIIVYWVVVACNATTVCAGLIWALLTTLIVLVLSCAFGWVVARINLKTRNKSFVAVIASLLFFAAYWLIYTSMQDLVENLEENIASLSQIVYDAASPLYFFGRAGEGDWISLLGMAAICGIALVLVWRMLSRSFLHIATGTGAQKKTAYREKTARRSSPAVALLRKELGRFTSSATYMLNCGLGILALPIFGVVLLWQGGEFTAALDEVFVGMPGIAAVLVCAGICLAATMNDTAAPSVSLEGKSLWLARSLPVTTWQILQAKLNLQYLLTALPALVCSVCAVVALRLPADEALLVLLGPQAFALANSYLGMTFGLLDPNLTWTNETAPVKRSIPVLLALIAGWVISLAFAILYLWQGWQLGALPCLIIEVVLCTAISLALRAWLKGSGCKRYEAL